MNLITFVLKPIGNCWQAAVLANREPIIYQKRNRAGNDYWLVYDPVTQRKVYLDSEQAVRIWLDQRHYS